ncbi:bifunctional UDP-N-acetylglucosamine diphosphorylase/glucosamine-1-phosphate N-acetyltransferase GlmU [Salicibibacter kimchii]|uniref:Bifunctional protein GlmU n=1 Tax=Salicibibacter kimchii TaxID=2099786 RepID=A0A345C056_9BACI|nr:bifunctional UDP-N-acetylglucosamine diphosphorylase/glucosamine-1-phosphate N-acetyltransferase GlmU [Salicibibacter kimchii]AXF56587.1 bifunctional UDP-N-acetylglucosamine diphosphorylase/glucosamine-1-phosphate N-acetyltransferase GlmU [Salicibibacter kimchii]
MDNRYAIVLAAGKGTRMKSKRPKVLHTVGGKPMVSHVVEQVQAAGFEQIAVVIGHEGEQVQQALGNDVDVVWQAERLGTGHAVQQAEPLLGKKKGVTLVISADTPMISAVTMQALSDHHELSGAAATVLTARVDDPTGLGRVIRDTRSGDVEKIVEHKDATAKERGISEINTATYCIDNEALFSALHEVTNDNAQQEYYLPDVIEILKAQGEKVSAWETPDASEALGINDRVALSAAEKAMQKRINEYWMKQGVTFVDPDHTYVSADTELSPDTTLYPGTMLRGRTVVGEGCFIGPHSDISDCSIADFTTIKQSTVSSSAIGEQVQIGPFAHIRPETNIANGAKVGNFVEIKQSNIGKDSKANHLSYIGDADVGEDVNLGCGAITVNYDGKEKHLTTIEDGAFIGCNANLVAPVTVGKHSFVAAGSTITENVPGEALSIARSRQSNKEGYLKEK